jgi:hypothetical protein
MRRPATFCFASLILATTAVLAQTPPSSASSANSSESNAPTQKTKAPPKTPPTSSRPDASYPHPSGQDSRPNTAPGANKSQGNATKSTGTVDAKGTQTSKQSPPVQNLTKGKTYTDGKKSDPGTACSTARTMPNGGLDCGTSGDGATPGKVPR